MTESLKNIDKDTILEALGLKPRSTWLDTLGGAVGVFTLGMLVGAGLGLIFAPRTGEELRRGIADKVRRAAHLGGEERPAAS